MPMEGQENSIHLTVIVVSFRRCKMLELCLKSIRRSAFRNYEVIVIDNESSKETKDVAGQYGDYVICNQENVGAAAAVNMGIAASKGEILVMIADDMVLFPDTLAKFSDYFSRHPEVDVIVANISKTHPNDDFFSQFKNLYMNYVFSRLPPKIDFISWMPAFRKRSMLPYDDKLWPEDTELGQRMSRAGRTIVFCPDIEAIHQKKYSCMGLIKNDFTIPSGWAELFVVRRGWRHVGFGGMGFAHASWKQLTSLAFTTLVVASGIAGITQGVEWQILFGVCLLVSYVLNQGFLIFLTRQRGLIFGATSFFFNLLDQLVMTAGMSWGFAKGILKLIQW